jgi:SagB-type dehydrogenase family enzyme
LAALVNIFRREDAFHAPSRGDSDIGALFHENTKLRHYMTGGDEPANEYGLAEIDTMAKAYKRYRQRPKVDLPPIPTEHAAMSLRQTIASRRSQRSFAAEGLTLQELASILQLSYGITGEVSALGGGTQPLRAAPSAGALYAAEVYVSVRDVRGLDAGIYHYEVPDNQLALLRCGDASRRLAEVCCGQEHALKAAATVLISGVVERTTRKYGDRGYRYVLLDVGHLGQNLYLSCTALGLSITTTCAFYDDDAAEMLGIDGSDEPVFYVGFIGRPWCAEWRQ